MHTSIFFNIINGCLRIRNNFIRNKISTAQRGIDLGSIYITDLLRKPK